MDAINNKLAELANFFKFLLITPEEPTQLTPKQPTQSIDTLALHAIDVIGSLRKNYSTNDDFSDLCDDLLKDPKKSDIDTSFTELRPSTSHKVNEQAQTILTQSKEEDNLKIENEELEKDNARLEELLKAQEAKFQQTIRDIQQRVTQTLEEQSHTQARLQQEIDHLKTEVKNLSRENTLLKTTNTQLLEEMADAENILREQQSFIAQNLRLNTSDYSSSEPAETSSEISSEDDPEAIDSKEIQGQLALYKQLKTQIQSNIKEFTTHSKPNTDTGAFIKQLQQLLNQLPDQT